MNESIREETQINNPQFRAEPKNSDGTNNKSSNVSTPPNLLDVNITNEHSALNVIVGFLSVAQKRGAFAINESAKLYECIKVFQKKI